MALNEKFLPGPAGLQTVCPNAGPLPADTGTYASLRFYWELANQGGGTVQGWDKTNGYFYTNGAYANTISWSGGTGTVNRDFVLRAWHDADNDKELDAEESRRSVFVKPVFVSAGQLAFVPSNATVSLAITTEPSSLPYTLVLSRESGASIGVQGNSVTEKLKNIGNKNEKRSAKLRRQGDCRRQKVANNSKNTMDWIDQTREGRPNKRSPWLRPQSSKRQSEDAAFCANRRREDSVSGWDHGC